ncbi:MAG: hypothetical protein FWD17_01535 [Polyangiaceae bacterium]|nr:hypothetical protein [Polyangiaceae bacterium]
MTGATEAVEELVEALAEDGAVASTGTPASGSGYRLSEAPLSAISSAHEAVAIAEAAAAPNAISRDVVRAGIEAMEVKRAETFDSWNVPAL